MSKCNDCGEEISSGQACCPRCYEKRRAALRGLDWHDTTDPGFWLGFVDHGGVITAEAEREADEKLREN